MTSLQVIPTWTSNIHIRTESVLQVLAQRYQIVVSELHVGDQESEVLFSAILPFQEILTRRHRQRDQKATPHISACNNRLSVAAGYTNSNQRSLLAVSWHPSAQQNWREGNNDCFSMKNAASICDLSLGSTCEKMERCYFARQNNSTMFLVRRLLNALEFRNYYIQIEKYIFIFSFVFNYTISRFLIIIYVSIYIDSNYLT